MVAEQFSVNLVTLFSLNSNCKVKLISTTVLTDLSRSKVRSCVNYSGLKWAPDFIFLCSKITMDGDCSREIKRWLLLGRKAMTNLDSVLKSRDISVLRKICRVEAMVLPVVMYGCELDHKGGWVPKNWCFQTVMLEKTHKSPQDCKIKSVNPKGNQPWLLKGLLMKLRFQYFGHLIRRANSLEKTLMLGRTEGKRRRRATEDEMFR